MESILEKISSYDFIICVIPGTLLVFLSEKFFGLSLMSDNLLVNFVLVYLAGLISSRVGSLIVEPIAKKIKFVKFAPYKDFMDAEKIDPKVDALSTTSNMYRTFIGSFLFLFLEFLFFKLCGCCQWVKDHLGVIVCVLLFVMFIFAYRKQVKYIKNRVENDLDGSS